MARNRAQHSYGEAAHTVFRIAQRTGLLRLVNQLRRGRNPLLILCYHGVSLSDEHLWNSSLYIDGPLFRQRLAAIRDFGYQVLPLGEGLERMRTDRLNKPTVAITFDDGWHDFYQSAWPILREFGYPATVYQTTFYSLYNRPVFDTACSYLLWKAAGQQLNARSLTGSDGVFDLRTGSGRNQAVQTLRFRAAELGLSAEQKDHLLKRLADAAKVDYGALLRSRTLHLMNPEEVRQISRAGVDVQLHTHRHRTPADRELFLRELAENRELILSMTGKHAEHFCYPNGVFSSDLLSWLHEAGVRSAVTCEPGLATTSDDVLLLPRFTDGNSVSQAKFESWLAGLGHLIPRLKRAVTGAPDTRESLEGEPEGETSASPKGAGTWA